jgi:16S rRNA (guanine527-N7)-methyltransferase
MFHVEPSIPENLEPAIQAVFRGNVPIALRYHATLATAGVERGLIGPREAERLWERHLLNCAVIGEMITEQATVVDVGSGAGLPGIPLAIARPDLRITLLEPLLRRVNFLNEFVDEAGLSNVRVVRGRAEERSIRTEVGGADVVTSRAVAPLLQLAAWSLPLVRDGGEMLALKGSSAQDELDRDGRGLARLGGYGQEVVLCGASVLDVPTTVIRVRRKSKTTKSRRG